MIAQPQFVKTPGWLDWHPDPKKPDFAPPPGAVDAHCHVFGPGLKFPFAPERKYTPCDASRDQLFALRDHLGFSRNVVVQATCHGSDNAAVIDAIAHSAGMARGVASIMPSITDGELEALDAGGIRSVRFNFVKRLVNPLPPDVLRRLVERLVPFGWHIVVYFEAQDLPELQGFLAGLPLVAVVDHMGRPDVSEPLDAPDFERLLQLMRDNDHIWSKVSGAERLSKSGPPGYDDFVPFARHVVESFPDRVLWGTDWPHPNLKSHMPDDGELVDLVPRIAPTPELRRKLLVDNPMRLYWPEEVDG